jgi:inorganic pyrophosphatase
MLKLSLDTQGSEAGLASLRIEVELELGQDNDPLDILIAVEDQESVGCSFPQCYVSCGACITKRA